MRNDDWLDWPEYRPLRPWCPTIGEIVESAINLAYASGMSYDEALDIVGRLVEG